MSIECAKSDFEDKMLSNIDYKVIFNKDKQQRKQILQSLCKKLECNSIADNREFFNNHHTLILQCFRDESEICRELSLDIVSKLLFSLELSDYYLTYIFPVLTERIGDQQIIEPSEEIRLSLITFMKDILKHYSKTELLNPFYQDITEILTQTLKDKHPKIKIASCDCVSIISELNAEVFQKHCEKLVSPILDLLSYQQHKVRIAGIDAICASVLHGTQKVLESSLVPLATKLFDQIPAVRQAILRNVGKWLLVHKNRYSNFHRILPLILTGLQDETPSIREDTCAIWAQIGDLYQKENESDLKDELLCETTNKWSLGCRYLVQRNTYNMIGAICSELSSSWQSDVKLRCAQLLILIVEHCAQQFTQHLQKCLPCLYVTSTDSDPRVQENVLASAVLMGEYVPSKVWFELVSPVLEEGATVGQLHVLEALLKGSNDGDLLDVIAKVVPLLSTVCVNQKVSYQKRLVSIAKVVLEKNLCLTDETLRFVYKIGVCAVAVGGGDSCAEEVLDLIPEGVKKDSLGFLVGNLRFDPVTWTEVSVERSVFNVIVSTLVLTDVEDLTLVLKVLKGALSTEVEAGARLSTFGCVVQFLQRNYEFFRKEDCFDGYFQELFKDVLLPNMTWHAGRKEEAVRTAALACLRQLLTVQNLPSSSQLLESHLVPTLITSLEDQSPRTRILTLQIVSLLGKQGLNALNHEDLWLKMYPNVLKCLDDPVQQVRLSSVQTMDVLLDYTPEELENIKRTLKTHIDYIRDTLFVHTDDQDSTFRNSILDVLRKIKGN